MKWFATQINTYYTSIVTRASLLRTGFENWQDVIQNKLYFLLLSETSPMPYFYYHTLYIIYLYLPNSPHFPKTHKPRNIYKHSLIPLWIISTATGSIVGFWMYLSNLLAVVYYIIALLYLAMLDRTKQFTKWYFGWWKIDVRYKNNAFYWLFGLFVNDTILIFIYVHSCW